MPATMSSVTTRGFGLGGGFTGSVNLVVTIGYGIGEAVAPASGVVRMVFTLTPTVGVTPTLTPTVGIAVTLEPGASS